jgi:hypothetical protein
MNRINKKLPVITKQQCIEFGQVATLIALFCALKNKDTVYTILGFIFILVTIIMPIIFYPFAIVWFSLSKVLSVAGPVVLLGLIFFIVVTPVGLFRRLIKKDSLRLNKFKTDTGSVLINRGHLFVKEDLLNTF